VRILTRDKVIEKLKSKRMKNNASSAQIASYIAGWNEALEYAVEQLKKD
jgi:hypothetical protein